MKWICSSICILFDWYICIYIYIFVIYISMLIFDIHIYIWHIWTVSESFRKWNAKIQQKKCPARYIRGGQNLWIVDRHGLWRFSVTGRHGYVPISVAVLYFGPPQISPYPWRLQIIDRHGYEISVAAQKFWPSRIRRYPWRLENRHGYVPHIRDHCLVAK